MQMMTYAAWHELNTVLAVPTRQIFTQTYQKFIECFPDKHIGRIGNGCYDISNDLTISTFKSLESCALERCRLLLADEIQCTTGTSISDVLVKARPIRLFGYTATDKHLFNGADKLLKGLFGERLLNITYAQAEGFDAVVPGVVWFVDMPESVMISAVTMDGKLSQGIKNCAPRNKLIGDICRSIPEGWQTIAFVDHIQDHLIKLHKQMPPGTRCIHREASKARAGAYALSDKEQAEVVRAFSNNEFQFLIATDAFRAGFDVQNCRVIVQCAGGTSVVEVLQEALRGSRMLTPEVQARLGVDAKTHFVLVDIMDNHDPALASMSANRMDTYRQQGWTIRRVRRVEDIDWKYFPEKKE
jgi:superfamily II DNA or RNA helicase